MPANPAEFQKLLEQIRTNNIRDISLSWTGITDGDINALISALHGNTSVTIIGIYSDEITDNGVQTLASFLSMNTRINYFLVSSQKIGDTGIRALASGLISNKSVTQLNIGHISISDIGAEALSNMLKINKQLTNIILRIDKLSDAGMQLFFTGLECNPSLTSIDFCGHHQMKDGAAKTLERVLQINNTLLSLNFTHVNIGDAAVRAIANILRINNTLQKINFQHNENITDVSVILLADALKVNNSLKSICFYSAKIADGGAQALANALRINTRLESLDLTDTDITETGAQALIAALESNYSLRNLSLTHAGRRTALAVSQASLDRVQVLLKRNSQYLQFVSNEFRITQGAKLVLSNTHLNVKNTFGEVTFCVTRVTGGRFFDVTNDRTLMEFTQKNVNAGKVGFIADGSLIPPSYSLTASDNTVTSKPHGGAIIFEVYTITEIVTLNSLSGGSVAYSPDGLILAVGSEDGKIRLWDVLTYTLLDTLDGHNATVRSVFYSSDGLILIAGFDGSLIKFWDTRTRALLRSIETGQGHVWSLAYSSNGKEVASGGWDRTVMQWDVDSGTLLKKQGGLHHVQALAYSPDGTTLLCQNADNTIKQWDVKNGALLRILPNQEKNILTLVYSPDGMVLSSGGNGAHDGVKQWNMQNGTFMRTLGDGDQVHVLKYSPDGRVLAAGVINGSNYLVKLWDAQSGVLIKILSAHRSYIKGLAYSPDGLVLASVSSDGMVKLWDVRAMVSEPGTKVIPSPPVLVSVPAFVSPPLPQTASQSTSAASAPILSRSSSPTLLPVLRSIQINNSSAISNPYYERASAVYISAKTAIVMKEWREAHSLLLQARTYLKDARAQMQINPTSFTAREQEKIEKRLLKIKDRLMPQIEVGLRS